MARDILHVGDVGIPIIVTVNDRKTKQVRDLSNFTSGTLRFQRPDNTTFDKACTKVDDGSAGEVRYIPDAVGVLNQAGRWLVQPVSIVTASDGPWSSDPEDFEVQANLADPA